MRKSSTVSTLSQGKLGPFARDNASLRKSSSAGAVNTGGLLGTLPGRKDNHLQPLISNQSGKFKPSFRSPSQGNIVLGALEEGSVGSLESDEIMADNTIAKGSIGSKSMVRGSVLSVKNPGLLSPGKRTTASRAALPSVIESTSSKERNSILLRPSSAGIHTTSNSNATSNPEKLRKLSTAPGGNKLLTPTTTTMNKSIRLNMLAPSLAEASETSLDSDHAKPKKPKSRKKSTPCVAAEPSLDDTTVSLALASPGQSPAALKTRKRSTVVNKRHGTPVSGEKASPTGTPEAGVKKRGTILKGGDKNSNNATGPASSVVTRLPPVQANVRLTRRKEA